MKTNNYKRALRRRSHAGQIARGLIVLLLASKYDRLSLDGLGVAVRAEMPRGAYWHEMSHPVQRTIVGTLLTSLERQGLIRCDGDLWEIVLNLQDSLKSRDTVTE